MPEPEALGPLERAVLHSATRRALLQMLDDAPDAEHFLAALQQELVQVLRPEGAAESPLLPEFEAVLLPLRRERARPAREG